MQAPILSPQSSEVVIVGSMAFDSIETAHGRRENIVGGSLNHFTLACSRFTQVLCVSAIGYDFPPAFLERLRAHGAILDGVLISETEKTFFWEGVYKNNKSDPETRQTNLNVFENFQPRLPKKFQTSRFLFLANMAPSIQRLVLDSMTSSEFFVGLDTMNYWIEHTRHELIDLFSDVDMIFINQSELFLLTGEDLLHKAVDAVFSLSLNSTNSSKLKYIVVKRGEYGVFLFSRKNFFIIPAFYIAPVIDPTGAGDSFSGAAIGYLAEKNILYPTEADMRRACAYGCVVASYNISAFGTEGLWNISRFDIEERLKVWRMLTQFD